MSDPVSRDEYISFLELLQKSIDDGFKGVHARQDITNGRIGKAEDRINVLASKVARAEGAAVKLWQIKGKLSGAAGAGAVLVPILKWAYDTFIVAAQAAQHLPKP